MSKTLTEGVGEEKGERRGVRRGRRKEEGGGIRTARMRLSVVTGLVESGRFETSKGDWREREATGQRRRSTRRGKKRRKRLTASIEVGIVGQHLATERQEDFSKLLHRGMKVRSTHSRIQLHREKRRKSARRLNAAHVSPRLTRQHLS